MAARLSVCFQEQPRAQVRMLVVFFLARGESRRHFDAAVGEAI